MQNITPMGRLKDTTNELKEVLYRFITNELTLNESSPKYNRYAGQWAEGGSTKGVENEFLRIFHTNDDKSFAFIFNNIKLELDKVIITVSIKDKEDFLTKSFNFNDFKVLLKELVKTLKILDKANALNIDTVYLTIEETFKIKEQGDNDKIVRELCKKIKSQDKKTQKELDKLNLKAEDVKKEITKCKTKITKETNIIKKELKYDELKETYLEAQRNFKAVEREINKKDNDLKKKLNLNELIRSETLIGYEIKTLNDNMKTTISKFTKPYDKNIKASVIEKLAVNP